MLPWDLTPLRALAGRRVIVAAPAGSKVPLDRALADAEQAAEVAGRWDGAVTLGPAPKGAPEDDLQARYGLALLAVGCLAKRFGEDRMLDFFAAVVRARSTPEAAAPGVFGTDWGPVAAGCTAEIRSRTK